MAITLPDIHSAREKYREVGSVYDFALLCHTCRKQMMLARVTPKTPGIDEVTYDCRACNVSEDVLTQR